MSNLECGGLTPLFHSRAARVSKVKKSAVKPAHSKMDNQASEELTRYLFGEMAEEEQTQLEAHYFADPQKFAELCAWRDSLIDRYVSDELSPSLRERFEAGIENAWAMNERIRFAETLQEAIDARHDGTKRPTPKTRVWQALRAFFYRHRKDLFIVAMVALLAVVALLIVSRL